MDVFERLTSLVEEMEIALVEEDENRRIVKIMKNTLKILLEGLASTQEQYDTCIRLNLQFQQIRKDLGLEEIKKEEKMQRIDADFKTIWEKVKNLNNKKEIGQLRSFLPQMDTSKSKILQEWVRLYHSYRPGLFEYYDFPIPAKTNSPMEQAFGQEKASIIKQMGRRKVGGQIRIKGENMLKQIYAGPAEIKEIISRIGPDYRKDELREGLLKLSKQTKEETMLWRNHVFKNGGILKVLKKGK